MRFIRLLSSFILVLHLFFSCLAFAGEGGSGGGNGGGGNDKPRGWTPMGIGKALSAKPNWLKRIFHKKGGWSVNYNIDSFIEAHPVLMRYCRQRPELLFPPLPDNLKGEILIQTEEGKTVDFEAMCEDDAIFNAYRSFMFEITAVNETKLFTHMIEKTVEINHKPIAVRLFKKGKVLNNIGKKIKESAWFDTDLEFIGWTFPGRSDGLLGALLARQPSALLVHEFFHVFTFRIYGGYDKNVKWHDSRQRLGLYEKENGIEVKAGTNYEKFHSTPYAAYIESLSNIMEAPYTMSHPMVNAEDDPGGCIQSDHRESIMCEAVPRFQIKIEQLLANEPYLTTAGWDFSKRYKAEKGEDGGVVYYHEESLLIQLIDVLFSNRQTNSFISLFINYDKMFQSDLGWKFVRQYFFYDYKTKETLYKHFGKVENGLFGYYSYSDKELRPESLYFSVIDKSRELAELESKKRKALTKTRETLRAEIRKDLVEIYKVLTSMEKAKPQIQSRLTKANAKISPLLGDKTTKENLTDKVYCYLINSSRLTSLMTIEQALEVVASGKIETGKQTASLETQLVLGGKLLKEMDQNFDIPLTSEEHIRQVDESGSLESNPKYRYKEIENILEALESPQLMETKCRVKLF